MTKFKNNVTYYFGYGLTVLLLSASVFSCTKDNTVLYPADTAANYLENLRNYKKSDHQIMAGYFRTWRDKATDPANNKTSMKELPDSLDIAFVFPDYTPETNAFWDSLKTSYVPHLRARGTKVVMTADIGAALDKNFPNTAAGYEALATKIINDKITKYDLDGIDFDVERSLNTEDLQRATGVFTALSKSLGPKSGTGKLLIYDTNQEGNTPLFTAVHGLLDYVLVQSYGRSVNGLQSTFNSYSGKILPNQYLIGFSFYEENGANWGDVTSPLASSRAYSYTNWNPTQGKKAGVFSYAIDRDGVPYGQNQIVPTNYPVTRQLISLVNP
ncbi:glycoside hydrolase family 18 [Sphingobacterium sp. BIGb0165]|uniref:glycoside hydrolase family 18 n=1 Tax=Sphingobacterium sp. BIGb0165 TaxID=2940615 RepID=UPI0021695A15|nr:glycoside hydrolase family 18 [Sphingobacterium sp. BIGb0165]MCS4226314.1 hypothetical protein [Sphingobacterium sp. BIGb0165]